MKFKQIKQLLLDASDGNRRGCSGWGLDLSDFDLAYFVAELNNLVCETSVLLEMEYCVTTDRAIMGECPICTFPRGKGHHKDCSLAKAIANATS